MQKGFTLPVLVISLAVAGAILAGYIGYTYKSSDKGDVKGITKSTDNGFSITVKSPDTWDFLEYLCTDMSECEKSATSGQKYSSISGGTTSDHELFISYSPEWSKFTYLKMFVKPAWGSTVSGFSIEKSSSLDDITVKTLTDGNTKLDALIVPIKSIMNKNVEDLAVFSTK